MGPQHHVMQDADREPEPNATGFDVSRRLPDVCLVADVARFLRVSESAVYQLRRAGRLRDFLLPQIDSRVRFNGKRLREWAEGKFEPRGLRKVRG